MRPYQFRRSKVPTYDPAPPKETIIDWITLIAQAAGLLAVVAALTWMVL